MSPRYSVFTTYRAACALGAAFLGLTASATLAAPSPGFRTLPGHIPAAVAAASPVSAMDTSEPVALALTLPLRHQTELTDLLRGLSDPSDPRYGQFLTPEQFAARFSPTSAEYNKVIAYAKAMGLNVTGTHSNRTVLDVSAPAGQVERAFGLHLKVYRANADGRRFFAPDADPQVPASLAGLVSGVVGLSNEARWQPHLVQKTAPLLSPALDPYAVPLQTGTGPGGALTPSDIKAAYNLNSVPQNGSGQALAVFELDGYTASDVTAYENAYGLPNVPLQNVLVDGFNGLPSTRGGNGPAEVTLDIELQIALAPSVSKVIVYEGPNSGPGVVDTYNKIAADNLAKQISTSWGSPESADSVSQSENSVFQQMAAQGQSIYAASGDSGANDNGSSLSVDDPASQPYMVGVGGTALATVGAGGAYKSETVWNNSNGGAGGGGISTVWPVPSYQSGLVGSSASKGSTTARNVPDVALDADPNTGYSIYFNGVWTIYGGTSCASPLWAAFTALVNQRRTAAGSGPLGFANPPIYTIGAGASYKNDFHDVADGSTNRFYPAATGYDDATGWGTFVGASLLADLAGDASPLAPSSLINDTSGSLSYSGSGWGYYPKRALGDAQDDVHATYNAGDSVTFPFTATSISVLSETAPDEGSVQIYLDGTLQATVSANSPARKVQQTLWSKSGLAAGSHTLKLVSAGGGFLVLDALSVSPSFVQTLNDTDGSLTYSGGGWGYYPHRGLGDVNDDVHATYSNGDSASCVFTGTSVSYVTETFSDEGNVEVYVDGVLKQTVSCASSTRGVKQTVFSVSGLSAGSHVLKLVKASGGYLVLDAITFQ